jgi:uncharacterized protein (DUF924 family)
VAGPEDVLRFWFGEGGVVPPEKMKMWFTRDDAVDRLIAEEFGEALECAAMGDLAEWDETPRGWVARIVVLDQFSRNVWRGTARAFAQDALARAVAEEGVERGDDQLLAPIERAFAYMPFLHSERPEDQQRSLELFGKLGAEGAGGPYAGYFGSASQYATKHHDVIARFGRFPHRNTILGRESTPEEADFLKASGGFM